MISMNDIIDSSSIQIDLVTITFSYPSIVISLFGKFKNDSNTKIDQQEESHNWNA